MACGAERPIVREQRVREANAERHQPVREEYVPQCDDGDAEQAVDATAVRDVDRLDDGSAEEDGRNRAEAESAEGDDTRAVHVAVDTRREPRRDAPDPGDSNVAAAVADHVPDPGQHEEPADCETDSASQEVGGRRQPVGGDGHAAAERTEERPEDGVRRRPSDGEQEVLSDLVGREVPGPSVAAVTDGPFRSRGSAVRV